MVTPRLYDSVRWRRLRASVLREEPLCLMCAEMGRTTAATTVDHIVPHGGDPVAFWKRDNLQSLCASCHSGSKRIQEGKGYSQACGVDGEPLDRCW